MLNSVAKLLKIPLSHAGLMLRRFKWDAQGVVDAYTTDAAAVKVKCGIPPGDVDMDAVLTRYRRGMRYKRARDRATGASRASAAVAVPPLEPGDSDKVMCNGCLEEADAWRMVFAGCGHELCDTCWAGHFAAQLQELGKDVVYKSHCPEVGCMTNVQQVMWEELARDVDLRKYKQFTLHTFVPLTGNVVWCPNPKCTRAIRYRHQRADLHCTCGMRFCVHCWSEAHSPATCEEFSQWKEDTASLTDLLTNRVLMQNYKKCPRCGVFMERTAGCNHITCKCGHQWCYMCKGDWSTHGSHTGGHYRCNIYEEAKNKTQLDWEGYSPEERDRVFAKDKEKRAQRFDETQMRVKRMEDGLDRTRHLLEVCRRVEADPNLLLKKHGIDTATASPSAAAVSAASASASAAAPAASAATTAVAQRTLLASVWNAVLSTLSRRDDGGDDGSDEDDAATSVRSTASPTRLSANVSSPASSPLASPAVDAATEHVVARERRRLQALIAAYETLYEFHRIEKWCTIHVFYMPDKPEMTLLRYNLEMLQNHASALFDMLDTNDKLRALDDVRLREKTNIVRQFCHNIFEEVEAAQALRGRTKPDLHVS